MNLARPAKALQGVSAARPMAGRDGSAPKRVIGARARLLPLREGIL